VTEVSQNRLHTSTAVLAADDHITDFQNINCVLDHSEDVEISFLDNVGDIPVDENLTWRQASDLVCRDAGVRAADPKILRALLLREPSEVSRVALSPSAQRAFFSMSWSILGS